MICKCEESCIKNKSEVLTDINKLYEACSDCHKKTFKKAIPLKKQIKLSKIDENLYKCDSCGKRHIDVVMAHILKIMIESNQISSSASIRQVGTPLITPAINLEKLPYLSKESLVLITKTCDLETSNKIINEVPEVKAVIKGDTNQTVGQITETSQINQYELLAGCDIRCDIQDTDVGSILIYKKQSKIHIEYPKKESPKIKQLSEILEKYDQPVVLDAMCGPGTLGIYALLKKSKKVVFNDIYQESLDSLRINLETNQIPEDSYEILNENLLDLPNIIKNHFDIGIIDAFPGVETAKYVDILKQICDEIIII